MSPSVPVVPPARVRVVPAVPAVLTVLALLALLVPLGACRVEEESPDVADGVGAEAPEGDVPGGTCKDTWAQGFAADSCTLANGDAPPVEPLDWPNVCNPQLNGWRPVQQSFDQLSWRSFLYESWPAGADGKPDGGQPIGVAQGGDFAPVVWERYADASSLFGAGAAELAASDYGRAAAPPEGCSADGPRVLSMTSKFPLEAVQAVREVLGAEAPAEGELLEGLQSIDQAFRGPLYPQGPEGPSGLWPVFYEIRINQAEYDAIVAAGAQDKTPAELNCTGAYATDDCTPFSFPIGSTEIKAAWKVLSDDEVASGRFFHQDLQVVDPVSGACSVQPMGLVGLHIARKVEAAVIGPDLRKNTWAWATFEQVDNVPPVGSDGSGGTYSFFDPSCTPAVDAATCAGVTTPNPDPQYQCCPNLYRYASGTVPQNPTPDQVTRIDSPPAGTESCNAVYDPLEKGVFDHYTLVTTQWPQASDGPHPPTVTPTHSRNAVIETYFTSWQGSTQVNTSSCMGCHSGAQAVDMSYLFLGNADE